MKNSIILFVKKLFKIGLLSVFFLLPKFSSAQEADECESWISITTYPISQLSSYKVIQKNDNYGFRLIYTDKNDTCGWNSFYLLDTRNDTAYQINDTFWNINDINDSVYKTKLPVKKNIFSPNGKYTAIKFFHFSGIPIVRTSMLRAYLQKKAQQDFCVDEYKPGYGPSPIHRVIGWKNNTKLRFSWGCCGTTFYGEYDIVKRKTKLLNTYNSSYE